MITLPASSWIRFMRLSQIFIIPSVVYLFWRPNWILESLATVLAYFVIGSCGLAGAILAIGKRLGYFRLEWDEESKTSLIYRMQKLYESMNPKR